MKGIFIMVDGLDASGKSVIINAFKDWFFSKKMKVFSLKEYCEEHKTLPEPEEIENFDVIASNEPTDALVGKAIRDELIKKNSREYSAATIAQAFSLDREILYKRIIIPALKQNKIILQDRGVVSTFVYQPVQEHIPLNELIKLPGNRLALEHAPNLLVLTKVSPEVVMERIEKKGMNSATIFTNLLFQRKISERYNSIWLRELFERFGTKIVYISTEPPATEEETKKRAVEVLEEFLRTSGRNFD
ncbi:MAG: dTMP kinase [Candidatus Woesearchaeota archaeon]